LGAFLVFLLVKRGWESVHCGLFLFLLSLAWLLIPFQYAALQLFLLFWVTTALLRPFQATRSAFSWVKLGRIDGLTWALLYLTGVLSTGALIVWAFWTKDLGAGLRMAQGFAQYPAWLVFAVGIPLFALFNAFAEEIVYRGMLQEALMRVFPSSIAVLLQASAFAAAHVASGFPNGAAGYAMVLVYGVMLGYVRVRTAGMLAPYLAHVLADLVIGAFLCVQVFLS
jgi:membrane protease YdiL (CAAX protease family)